MKKLLFWLISLPFRILSTILAVSMLLLAVKVGESVFFFVQELPGRLNLSPDYVYYMGIPIFLFYLGICVGLIGVAVRISLKFWQADSFSELLGLETSASED
jgi:hypothetical protein